MDAFVRELSNDLHVLLAFLLSLLGRDELVVALLHHGGLALPPVRGNFVKRDTLVIKYPNKIPKMWR